MDRMTRVRAIASFAVQLEGFDPVTALKALGFRREPFSVDRPFQLRPQRSPRLTWFDLRTALPWNVFNDISSIAESHLGYLS